MKVSIVQLNVASDRVSNMRKIERLILEVIGRDHPDLIVLPELSLFMSSDPASHHVNAEGVDGQYATMIAGLSKTWDVNICLGSFIEKAGSDYFNTSLIYGRDGMLLGRYRKIHRFDVRLANGTEIFESKIVEAGRSIEVCEVDGIRVGMSTCYDLRFAELFLNLAAAGASLIILPSAFTAFTGADHWEVLVRARAIETQCYVVAPNQTGSVDDGRLQLFGHSMIVDPWGSIVAQISQGDGFVTATLDEAVVARVRSSIPVRSHRVISRIRPSDQLSQQLQ